MGRFITNSQSGLSVCESVYWLMAHAAGDITRSRVHQVSPTRDARTTCGRHIPDDERIDVDVTRCDLPVVCANCLKIIKVKNDYARQRQRA